MSLKEIKKKSELLLDNSVTITKETDSAST